MTDTRYLKDKIDQILLDFDEKLKWAINDIRTADVVNKTRGTNPEKRALHLSKINHIVVITAMRLQTWLPQIETNDKESNV